MISFSSSLKSRSRQKTIKMYKKNSKKYCRMTTSLKLLLEHEFNVLNSKIRLLNIYYFHSKIISGKRTIIKLILKCEDAISKIDSHRHFYNNR